MKAIVDQVGCRLNVRNVEGVYRRRTLSRLIDGQCEPLQTCRENCLRATPRLCPGLGPAYTPRVNGRRVNAGQIDQDKGEP